MHLTKPPLGVMPRYIWIKKRISELKRAITEYMDAELEIPAEWIDEYNLLLRSTKPNVIVASEGHADPVGLRGPICGCPKCGRVETITWDAKTDISSCVCGWTNG